MDIYQHIDNAKSAIAAIDTLMTLPNGVETLANQVARYTEGMCGILSHQSYNTYYEILIDANALLSKNPSQIKFSREEWLVYLSEMPTYSNALEGMISDDAALNAAIVSSTLKWESKADAYINLNMATALLKHRDYESWAHYVTERRHTPDSQITAIKCLCHLPPGDLGALEPVIRDLLDEHPWRKDATLSPFERPEEADLDNLYENLWRLGEREMVHRLIDMERLHHLINDPLRVIRQMNTYGFKPSDKYEQSLVDQMKYSSFSNNRNYAIRAVAYMLTCEHEVDFKKIINGYAHGRTNLEFRYEIFQTIFDHVNHEEDDIRKSIRPERVDDLMTEMIRLNYTTAEDALADFENFGIPKEMLTSSPYFKRLSISNDFGL